MITSTVLDVTPARTDVPTVNRSSPAYCGPSDVQVCNPLRRLSLPIVERREVAWSGTRADLIVADPTERAEIEILQPLHTVIMRYGGISTATEWHDQERSRILPAIRPGAVSFIAAGSYVRCAMKIPNPIQFLWLSIDPDAFLRHFWDEFTLREIQYSSAPLIEHQEVRRLLRDIKDEIDRPGLFASAYCQSLTEQLVVQLARASLDGGGRSKFAHGRSGLASWRLRKALELLDGDLDTPPTIEIVARHVGLSTSHFCHAFKRTMRLSPHQYIIQRRIAAAKALMADKRLSLTEIALRCGFGGSSQFSAAFHRATGASPRKYRYNL